MQTVDFQLRGEFVALCDLLKLTGIADSGGAGKALVASGEVSVDGQPESRKAAKIRAGQVVDCLGVRIQVQGGEGGAVVRKLLPEKSDPGV
jgi:ribosome-associated protein